VLGEAQIVALRTPTNHRCRTRALLTVIFIALGFLGASPVTHAVAGQGGSPSPFDSSLAVASPRLVLAHYVPWFPRSLDNRPPATDYYAQQYLDPNGEGGVHKAYGGFIRDRPMGRGVDPSPSWRYGDMVDDVRTAATAGFDGFAVDVVSIDPASRSWANVVLLLTAASDISPRFKILLQPDMTGLTSADPTSLASAMSKLAEHNSALRGADGSLVVSPFFADKRPITWWTQYLQASGSAFGTRVAFFPLLNDDVANGAAFAPISMGMGNWGTRNPAWNSVSATGATSPLGRIRTAHGRGSLWMQPVSVQDERPRSGLFDEAANTQNLRATWDVARLGGADWVLVPTWNDWAEGTAVAPSQFHGYAFLDVMAYYIAWFKSGVQPDIVRDGVYLTHRRAMVTAAPRFPQTRLMTLRGGTPARDTVESLNFLTAPSSVAVDVGGQVTTCEVPAGISTCVAPLRPGSVSVTVTRSAAVLISLESPTAVVDRPYVQDLQYVAVSSLRTPGATHFPPDPAPSASATSSPSPAATPPEAIPAPTDPSESPTPDPGSLVLPMDPPSPPSASSEGNDRSSLESGGVDGGPATAGDGQAQVNDDPPAVASAPFVSTIPSAGRQLVARTAHSLSQFASRVARTVPDGLALPLVLLLGVVGLSIGAIYVGRGVRLAPAPRHRAPQRQWWRPPPQGRHAAAARVRLWSD
jgi:hypothetical protein